MTLPMKTVWRQGMKLIEIQHGCSLSVICTRPNGSAIFYCMFYNSPLFLLLVYISPLLYFDLRVVPCSIFPVMVARHHLVGHFVFPCRS